jgi:F0F1-type ATP synthase assembly protein I
MAVNKQDLYKWVKIAGMLSFIPFILIAGISAGYFIGNLLIRRLNAPALVMPVFVVVGIFVSAVEVIRIVRLAIKVDRQDKTRV